MRGSRNFRPGGGGGGGGGSTSIGQKSSDNVVFWLLLFFSFFLVLSLFYRSQMVNFKEKYHFWRFRRGSKFLQWGGGTFFQGGGGGGSNCLFLIETRITCDFPGGGGVRTPCPPSGSALGCDLFSFPVCKMMRSPLAPVLVFLQLCCMFSVGPHNKIVSWTYCMTVAWFIQHLLQFVFAFFNHSIKIAHFRFAGGHFFSFPSHFDRDDAFRHQCKRMTSYPMT